ncbi:malonic semialdehyde reductase [Aeromicrobium camelliae]|uniref:Putative NADH dehydrogenase/NAD(P)H nitroreductase EHW97_02260 n=1 Tax=Aeromicrobium camelliae TaxID=1538144 RepID=A0A3N6X7S7_9ACTN|nr:malonic semialdehyde reductase [Aeromicrobium camelliae]RQN09688.1 malonic semialdehyde reductase [Aeromicrobium camelliae]
MTSATLDHLTRLDEQALDTLFREGRTANSFSDEPVPAATLEEIYEIAKFGPTAANSQPLRIVFLTTDESKQRLLPLMSEGNRGKTAMAPVVAILAADADFNERMPELFPHAPESKDWFGDLESRRRVAEFNAGLQVGYLIMAVRAVGLAAGPMNGFDHDAVDAEFFAGTNLHSVVVMNIGKPGESPWFDRLPRLAYEDAVTVL